MDAGQQYHSLIECCCSWWCWCCPRYLFFGTTPGGSAPTVATTTPSWLLQQKKKRGTCTHNLSKQCRAKEKKIGLRLLWSKQRDKYMCNIYAFVCFLLLGNEKNFRK